MAAATTATAATKAIVVCKLVGMGSAIQATPLLRALRDRFPSAHITFLTLRGNVRLLNRFEALTADCLLRGGVRVYLYPAMTHVKAMSADGAWAYLGTGNFDELSLRNNREVGLSVTSPGVSIDIEAVPVLALA